MRATRKKHHRSRRRHHRYGRDASRKTFPKGLKRYQDFVDGHIRDGKTREQATKLWHKLKKNKRGAVKAASKRRASKHGSKQRNKRGAVKAAKRRKTTSTTTATRKRKKGKKMATRALPPEIQALARALKEAGAKPQGPAKATKIEKQLEGALRAMRRAQKNAESAARREREDNEIQDKARTILGGSGLYDGDPSRRKGRGLKAFLAAGGTRQSWKRLSKKTRAKWARKGPKGRKKSKGRKTTRTRRDPGRKHRSHRARRVRHSRRRHGHGHARRRGRRHPR